MSLLLVPATRENIEASIEQSVDIDFCTSLLPAPLISTLLAACGNDGIRCWALTESRRSVFEQIANGDEVLLSEKGTGRFNHFGIVVGKIQSREFGERLWPFLGVKPWEYIYFLANVVKVSIEKSDLVELLGYDRNYAVPGSIITSKHNDVGIESISKYYNIFVREVVADCATPSNYSALNIQITATRRQGHYHFAKQVKENYGSRCAICGIEEKEFLVAGHIVSWAEDAENRLNPANGICLCALHDKAFEYGYITIDEHYKVRLGCKVLPSTQLHSQLIPYDGKEISMPVANPPNQQLLASHRMNFGN